MILQFLRFILSSLGLLFFVFAGQPPWTALHGTVATIPLRTHPLRLVSAPINGPASKSGLSISHSYSTS